MAKISRRERVLLGYDPDSASSFSSDVDFSDVFGGPPRRFSIQESRNGSFDYGSSGEDGGGIRGPFLGFGEKPVFGNEMGARRRYPSDDFFGDIFRGDQSSPSCSQSSPRFVNARDSYSSAPGSRVMSPSRPLPHSAEPFITPAKFSLPVRLTSTDFVASPSASQSWTPPSSLSSRFSQTTQSNDNGHGDARSSYRPSRLSYQPSVDAKDSTKPAKVQSKTGFGKDSKRSAVQIDSAQFHFSIYKWANKGVPLSMLVGRKSPSRSKENVKIDRSLSATVSDFLVGGNLKVAVIDEQSQSVKSSNSTITYSKSADSHSFDEIAQELSKSVSNSSSLLSTEKPVIEDINVHGFETPRELKGSSEKGSLQKESKASNPKPSENMRKFNTKTLGSFLQNEKKDDIVMAENGEKDRKIKDKEKPSLEDFVPSCKVNKVKAESFRGAKDDFQKGEAAGAKVKDFVKLFNQERSSKATKNIQGRSQSSRWRETNSTFEAGNDKSTAKTHEDGPVSSVNWETTPAEDSEMADGDSFLSGKPQVDICNSGRVSSAPNPVLPNEPTTKGVRDFTSTTNATRKDDLPTKNSMQEVNLQAEVEKNDEMKSYEDKVRKWSKGKEGNIRALLSTLPYVLWPNSGWKPVPLVDIIEGNAVKRSYQRALLCLHPDKLQQKGAEPHQKFVAEKVFDVLQEAWDHFNSLGTL